MAAVKRSSYKGVGVLKLSVLQFRGEPNGHSAVIANLFYNGLVKVLNKEPINVRKCFWTLTKRTVRHVGEGITKEVIFSPVRPNGRVQPGGGMKAGDTGMKPERGGETTVWDGHFQAFLQQAG